MLLCAFLFAFGVYARVGGGESYSGGGSSSDGDGGGGAELLYYVFRFLLWLTINHPAIGVPVDIVVIVVVVRYYGRKNELKIFTVTATPAQAPRSTSLSALRQFDANFSEITFSDFCYALYARAHEARGRNDLARYAPYLSEAARRALVSRSPQGLTEVRGIVIGSFRIAGVRGLDTALVNVTVAYESNYTEVVGTREQSSYVREQWTLERKRDLLSPPPEKSKAEHCPRCGAALRTRTDGACEYCGVKIESGAFQWYVRAIQQLAREQRGPLLTSNVPEQGTELGTIVDPRFASQRAEFESANPGFEQRVREIANELQSAWTAREWERVRPLETDSLFQMHRYWIDAYRRQKLRNIVGDYAVTRVEPVKLDSDAFYESVTVRVWAQGRDHTVDEKGNVVAGSKTEVRRWSEYWTFIRTRAAADGTRKVACPNCGAQVTAGATGVCEFCGGRLSGGAFDWVLSRIEQDDSYGG